VLEKDAEEQNTTDKITPRGQPLYVSNENRKGMIEEKYYYHIDT
jgi:hypothetical protein